MLNSVIDALWYFYKEQDPYIESLREKSSCSPSCNHCCYALIRYSVAEAILIQSKFPVSGEKIAEYKAHLHEVQNNPDAWYKKHIPCIHMENDKCGIYSVRPWICRSFYVTTPAENCAKELPLAMIGVREASKGYFDLLKSLPFLYGAIPQALALRWANAWIVGGVKALGDVVQEDIGTPA